jgi:hypothetical protein
MATATYADKSLMANLGPMKMEFAPLTAVGAGDTYTSRMQNPTHAAFFPALTNGTTSPHCTISGRTVTITNADTAGSGFLLVFGW